jgi:hypothetical protein
LALVFIITHIVMVYQATGPGRSGSTDVALYAWWVQQGQVTGGWIGINAPFVYPVGALVPMLIAAIFGTVGHYMATWCWMVAAINLATTAIAVKAVGLARAAIPMAGWFIFLTALGPSGITRLDAVMMPLVLIALLLMAPMVPPPASDSPPSRSVTPRHRGAADQLKPPTVRSGGFRTTHPVWASCLITLSAWLKVAGGASIIPLFCVIRGWRQRLLSVVLPAGLTCAAVILIQRLAGGSWTVLTSFVRTESDRGLQIEAVLATPAVLAHLIRGEQIWQYNQALGTSETWGLGAEIALHVSDWMMPLAVLAVGVLCWLARRSGIDTLLLGTLAILTGLIVFHKVGSPQFVAWCAPPVVVAWCLQRPGRLWFPTGLLLLVSAVFTGALYPWGYMGFLGGEPFWIALWVIRNLITAGIFAWAMTELFGLARAGRRLALAEARSAAAISPAETAISPAEEPSQADLAEVGEPGGRHRALENPPPTDAGPGTA